MSEGRETPSRSDDTDEDVPKHPEIASLSSESENVGRTPVGDTSLDTIVPEIGSDLSQRQSSSSGNKSSHSPGSSKSDGVLSPTRRTTFAAPAAPAVADDVEAQVTDLPPRTRGRGCSASCPNWVKQIEFQKWYEWMSYYIPILEWLPNYKLSYILRDMFAGLTLASISIPMSLSYAANLAKIRPINGLYATIAAPLVYAILGKTRRLAVLPEAALSLVVGEAIRQNIGKEGGHPHIGKSSEMASLITFLAALITFCAGMFRLGFVDIIGSPPLLRGFISGVAIVIFTEQLIPELGLEDLAKSTGAAHSSAWEKAKFIGTYYRESHLLTLYIALGAFLTLIIAKSLKGYCQTKYKKNWISLIPDILAVVAVSAWLTWFFGWDAQGVTVLGEVESGSFTVKWPFSWHELTSGKTNIRAVFSSAIVVAILGYFETMVGVKHLSMADNDVSKPNRELVALGAVNGVVSLIPGLPVYGGLARSKINEYSGSRTLLSGVSLAFFTYLAAEYLLEPLAWLPKASLSAVISTVCLGLLIEAPEDFKYYWSMRAWTELGMISLVIATTIFWSIDVGIYVGIGFSLLLLVKAAGNYSMKPLKIKPGNSSFIPIDALDHQFYPFVLMVKIATDNLTFVNTARIKEGLNRLERYGTFDVHPSEQRTRFPEDNVNVIFDFSGVTYVDPSATQILRQIIQGYRVKQTEVYFVGLTDSVREVFTRAKIWELLGDDVHTSDSLESCLQLVKLQGGNQEEARNRAEAEGRTIEEELHRLHQLERGSQNN